MATLKNHIERIPNSEAIYAVRKMFWSPGDKVAVVQDGETKMYGEVVNEHWQGKYLVKELGRPANAMIVRWDELESVPLPY